MDYKGSPVSMADIMAEKYEQKWEPRRAAKGHAQKVDDHLKDAYTYTVPRGDSVAADPSSVSVGGLYWSDDDDDTGVDEADLPEGERKDVETAWNYWATEADKEDLQEYVQAITRAGYDYQEREKEVVNYKKMWYDKRINDWTGSRGSRCDCGEAEHNFGRHIDGCPAKPKDER